MRKSMIGFDATAIGRAHKLRMETRALRQQTRALICRVHAADRLIRGISEPMLTEFAYDLTALGLHEFSRRCRVAAEGWWPSVTMPLNRRAT